MKEANDRLVIKGFANFVVTFIFELEMRSSNFRFETEPCGRPAMTNLGQSTIDWVGWVYWVESLVYSKASKGLIAYRL